MTGIHGKHLQLNQGHAELYMAQNKNKCKIISNMRYYITDASGKKKIIKLQNLAQSAIPYERPHVRRKYEKIPR